MWGPIENLISYGLELVSLTNQVFIIKVADYQVSLSLYDAFKACN